MTGLQVADLVLIASRVLGVDTAQALDLLDVRAAEAALADVEPVAAAHRDDPAVPAAALLAALIRRAPLRHGNEQVALVSTAQFLALNGMRVDFDPPHATRGVVADVAAGRVGPDQLAEWLFPRVRGRSGDYPCSSMVPVVSWLPWLPTRRRRRGRPVDRFHRYTDQARRAVIVADAEARDLGHARMGTEHLLLALVADDRGVAGRALRALGASREQIRGHLEPATTGGGPAPAGYVPVTPQAKRTLFECSLREALRLGHSYIGTEHLLLALLAERDGPAARILTGLGVDIAAARGKILALLAERPGDPRDLLRGYAEQMSDLRRRYAAATDRGDTGTAATLRAAEKRVLDHRRRDVQDWLRRADPVAVIALIEDGVRAHDETEHLRALLRRHGIEPDGPAADTGTGR